MSDPIPLPGQGHLRPDPTGVGGSYSASPGLAAPWMYTTSPAAGTRMRLFCFPYAGSGASIYRLWPGPMPGGVEVCRLQLPGRETRIRERPYHRMDDLLDALLDGLKPYLDVPFAFFGHSMGATLALELAHALHNRLGYSPSHLIVSGQRAPQFQVEPAIATLPDEAFLSEVGSRYGGIPDSILQEPELVALMLPVLRADIALCESVRSTGARLPCPITAYGGSEDSWVSAEHLEGWSEHTTGAFRSVTFPGGHFFLNEQRESVLADVSRTLRAVLARA